MRAQSLIHVRLSATPWTVTRQAPLSMGLSRQKKTGLACCLLLQGICLTQGSNIGMEILYH